MPSISSWFQSLKSKFQSPASRLHQLASLYDLRFQEGELNLKEAERLAALGVYGKNPWRFWEKETSQEDAWKELDYSVERTILRDGPGLLEVYLKTGYPVNRVLAHNLLKSNLLLTTARRGSAACLKVLLNHGADVMALNGDDNDVLTLLLELRNNNERPPMDKMVSMVNDLLEKGFPIEGAPGVKMTPLISSIALVSVPLVQLLLEKGASIAPREDMEEGSPLHAWAEYCSGYHKNNSSEDNREVLWDLLVEYGADPEYQNPQQQDATAFMWIAPHDGDLAHLMYKKGVNLQHVTAEGNTILHILALNYNYQDELCQHVVEHYPHMFASKNKAGLTPLEAVKMALAERGEYLGQEYQDRLLEWEVAGERGFLNDQTVSVALSPPTRRL